MAKRITVSVPEALAKKIDAAVPKLKLSSIFQKAVTVELYRMEERARLLRDMSDLSSVIARLKEERSADLMVAPEGAYKEGEHFVLCSSYKEIKAALATAQNLEEWDPEADNVLGSYFQSLKDQGKYTSKPKGRAHSALWKNWLTWVTNWHRGVTDMWGQIEQMLD